MKAIIVFGDSIVHGRGESPNIGWVGRLKEFFERQDIFNCVFNLGIPGDTTRDLLKRFDAEIESRVKITYEGDRCVVIIAIGLNDTRGISSEDNIQVSIDEYAKNINKLVGKTKNHTNDIVIVGLTPVDESLTKPFDDTFFTNERILQYNQKLKDIAKELDVHFIDVFDTLISGWNKKLMDGVHPNSEGYTELYEIIENKLLKEGYIEDKGTDNSRYKRIKKK